MELSIQVELELQVPLLTVLVEAVQALQVMVLMQLQPMVALAV
jgi:hypothetical protein